MWTKKKQKKGWMKSSSSSNEYFYHFRLFYDTWSKFVTLIGGNEKPWAVMAAGALSRFHKDEANEDILLNGMLVHLRVTLQQYVTFVH